MGRPAAKVTQVTGLKNRFLLSLGDLAQHQREEEKLRSHQGATNEAAEKTPGLGGAALSALR
jgi:hypothetical protein